jgi:hypothetical protein
VDIPDELKISPWFAVRLKDEGPIFQAIAKENPGHPFSGSSSKMMMGGQDSLARRWENHLMIFLEKTAIFRK